MWLMSLSVLFFHLDCVRVHAFNNIRKKTSRRPALFPRIKHEGVARYVGVEQPAL